MGEGARGTAIGGGESGFAGAGARADHDQADHPGFHRADRVLAACSAWLRACLAEEVSRRRLFPWCAVAFGLGILLFFAAEGRPHAAAPLAALALCAVIAWLGRHDHRILRITIAVTMVLAGFTATMLRFERVDAPIIDEIRIAQLTGSVISIEERTSDARLVIRVKSIDDGARDALPARVRVTTRAAGDLRAGDTITARVRLMPPPEAAWPGGYDFARSAWFARIGGVGSILGDARIVAPETPPAFAERVRAAIDNARVSTTRRIFDAIGGQPGAVAAALVTGKRGLITEETNAALRAAGIYHIVILVPVYRHDRHKRCDSRHSDGAIESSRLSAKTIHAQSESTVDKNNDDSGGFGLISLNEQRLHSEHLSKSKRSRSVFIHKVLQPTPRNGRLYPPSGCYEPKICDREWPDT